ncbi:GmrSD restriction endonuclease domain-containing protein [Demequina pelophila]|uniref:GmrSD restriction endonuclease domain-containing protein n=1 Tax=Demequina pelophila TaxID=1638984 RepID=UPI000785A33B|nr:DUF262 domain-containing protein [Demequina pelophila]
MLASGKVEGLGDAIARYAQIEVAEYQRNYAWGNAQIDELFEDLVGTAETGQRHFVGTLILQDTEDEKHCAVVDGQQRLTTLFMLASRLRDEATALPSAVLDPVRPGGRPRDVLSQIEDFIYASHDSADSRFKTNPMLRTMFEEHVHASPRDRRPMPRSGISLTLALRRGYYRLQKLVREDLEYRATDAERLQRIATLFDALRNNLLVLCISTSALAESLEVFMTLNNRGLPLGPADIVRGTVLQHITKDLPEAQAQDEHVTLLQQWEDLNREVGTAAVDQYLRHYLVSTSPEKVQKKAVPTMVERRIADDDPLVARANALAFWQDLCDEASVYGDLLTPAMGGDTEYHLQVLATLADSYRVMALAALSDNVAIASEDRAELVRLCNVLTVRWFMAGRNAQELETRFQEVAVALRDSHHAAAAVQALRGLATFDFDAQTYMRERGSGVAQPRAILHGIERALAQRVGEDVVPFDPKKLFIEQVAPERVTPAWRAEVFGPDGEEYDGYQAIVTAVGNKTLVTSRHTKTKDTPFAEKRARFATAKPLITRDLADVPEWAHFTIEMRNAWLAEMFGLIWSVDPRTDRVEPFVAWAQANMRRGARAR